MRYDFALVSAAPFAAFSFAARFASFLLASASVSDLKIFSMAACIALSDSPAVSLLGVPLARFLSRMKRLAHCIDGAAKANRGTRGGEAAGGDDEIEAAATVSDPTGVIMQAAGDCIAFHAP